MAVLMWLVFGLGMLGIGCAARFAVPFILQHRAVWIAPRVGYIFVRQPTTTWRSWCLAALIVLAVTAVYTLVAINFNTINEAINVVAREVFGPYTS
jgi:hypothetical protein